MTAARAGTIYLCANLISSGIPLFLLPFLTRVLSPEDYGTIVIFQLMVSASTAFSGLSVHGAIGVAWFQYDRREHPYIVGAGLIVAAASTSLCAVVAATIGLIFGADLLGINAFWLAMAAVTAGLNILLQCRLVLWQSQQLPLSMASVQMTASGLNVGLSIFLILALGWGPEGRNAGIAMSALIMALIAVASFFYLKQAVLSFRSDQVRWLLGFGLPLIPHSLAGLCIAMSDRYLVSAHLGSDAIGVYGAAAQLGSLMLVIGDAFGKAFKPWLFQRMATQKSSDALIVVGALYASIPIFLLVAVFLGTVFTISVPILLGPEYRSAIEILPLLIIGGGFGGIYVAMSGLFFFSGRTALLSGINMAAAVVGFLLTYVLVKGFSVEGAATGYAVTQALLALSLWVSAFKAFPLPWGQVRAGLEAWLQSLRAIER